MSHHIDFRLRPLPDVPLYVLLEQLFHKVHVCLARHGQGRVGVSFPEYGLKEKRSLGDLLRLHGSQADLLYLMEHMHWVANFRDYLSAGPEICADPAKVQGYACFARFRPRGNVERLIRRRMKRAHLSYEQAREEYREYTPETPCWYPYLSVRSSSNDNHYPLFVVKSLRDQPQGGAFGSYGLSSQTTVPLFR